MPSPRRLTAVFLLYLLLSVVYTWPLASHITTHVPDIEETMTEYGDAGLATWYPWRVQQALLRSDREILYSNRVYHPHGMEMTMQPLMILHGAMTVPLWWMEFATAHNIVILISYAISGLGAFLLGFHVLGNWPGALFCGFIYAFCPYKSQHLVGHYHLMATETLPFLAWALLRLYDAPDRKRSFWAALCLGLTVFADYYYFSFGLLFFAWITLYRLYRTRAFATITRYAILTGVLAFVMASPILVPALQSVAESDYGIIGGQDKHKADLLSPVVPSARQWLFAPLQPLLGEWLDMTEVDGTEHSIYIGLALLVLCGAYARRAWRASDDLRFFLLSAALFLVLAFGPRLGINGVDEFGLPGWKISLYLPGYVLKELPFFEGARAIGRISILAMMSFGIWGGFALRELLRTPRVRWGRRRVLVGTLAFGITALEYIAPPALGAVYVPEWARQMARNPETGAVVDVPMMTFKRPRLQIYHGRKVLMAGLGRQEHASAYYYWRHPSLRFLTIPEAVASELPTADDAQRMMDLLDIRYVTVSKSEYNAEFNDAIEAFLINVYGLDLAVSDDSTLVLQNTRVAPLADSVVAEMKYPDSELHLAYGWSNRQGWGIDAVAWLQSRTGKLVLPALRPRDYELTLDLVSLQDADVDQRLTVSLGGTEVGDAVIQPGKNRLAFHVAGDLVDESEPNLLSLQPALSVDLPHLSGFHVNAHIAHVPLKVTSGGYWTPFHGQAEVRIDKALFRATEPGVMVVALNPENGEVLKLRHFDTKRSAPISMADLEAYILSIPEEATVTVSVMTDGSLKGGDIGQALRWLGTPANLKLGKFDALALIGSRDGRPPIYNYGPVEAVVAVGEQPKMVEGSLGLVGFSLKEM